MPLSIIPPIGLGTFRIKKRPVQQSIREAIKIGYRHIDTAGIYKNEVEIGLVLQEIYSSPSPIIKRPDIWLTSKLSPYDMKTPREALLKSLNDLQSEYLDLYLIHWPALSRKSVHSPEHKRLRIEAWNVLNEAREEGLIRHIGLSNFTVKHLQELKYETKWGIKGCFVQMEIHPWYFRDALEIQNVFKEDEIVMTGYALLAEGKLFSEDCPKVLGDIAEKNGMTKVQIVLAWALKRGWGVLVKSQDVTHMKQNFEAESLVEKLSVEDCDGIEAVSEKGEKKVCWDPRAVK